MRDIHLCLVMGAFIFGCSTSDPPDSATDSSAQSSGLGQVEKEIGEHLNGWLMAQRGGHDGFEYWDKLSTTPVDEPNLSPFAQRQVDAMRMQVKSERATVRENERKRLLDSATAEVDIGSPEVQSKLVRTVDEATKGLGFPFEERKTVVEAKSIKGITDLSIALIEDFEQCDAERETFYGRQARVDCIIEATIANDGQNTVQKFKVGLLKNQGQWGIVVLVGPLERRE